MDEFNDNEIARLLRLKRYEQPPPGYFENFLHEFHRRQRDEILRQPLWRISVPQVAQPLALGSPQLVEWGGGVRWLCGELDAFALRSSAERANGHATLFRGGDKSGGVFQPLAPAILKIHRRLKAAFDPAGILNPGRMYDL